MSHFKLRSTLPTVLAGLVSLSLSTGVMAQRTPVKSVPSSGATTLRKANPVKANPVKVAAPATETLIENTNVERAVLTPQQLREAGVRDNLQLFNSVADIAAMPLPAGSVTPRKIALRTRAALPKHTLGANFVRAGAPTLYSNIQEYEPGTHFDTLWKFPTLYGNAANESNYLNIPVTFDGNPPSGFSNCLVFYGEMGQPADITLVQYGGNIRLIDPATGNLVDSKGYYDILVFDGVDAFTPPDAINNTNLAQQKSSTAASPKYVAYRITALGGAPISGPAGINGVDFTDDPIRIKNPRGKFGIMIAKDTATNADGSVDTTRDGGLLAQWIWLGNAAVGNNAAWKLNPVTNAVIGSAPVSIAADANFNQSPRNNYPNNLYGSTNGGTSFSSSVPTYGTLNALIQVNGYPLGTTTGQTGGLATQIRKRGFNVPSNTPESAPNHYLVVASDPTSSAVVRADQGYTQPSYGSASTNYNNTFIEGYPVATAGGSSNYKFTLYNLPIYTIIGGSPVSDQITTLTQYPGGDFFSLSTTNPVAIKDFQGSSTNFTSLGIVRFPRYADISAGETDSNGILLSGQDGIVDVNDLTYLLFAFNTTQGEGTGLYEQYPAGDIAGPGTVAFPDRGGPNGIIDVDDLTALLFVFNTGSVEKP